MININPINYFLKGVSLRTRYGFFIMTIFLYLLMGSCANIKDISGGPTDKTSPKLVISKSSQNFVKQFNEKKITLYFDEWVKLDNPQTNIIITPLTEFPLQYKLKGKSLQISFDKREKLKEQTTYTIQFGEAIKDITANNSVGSFKYVFSTGDYIDSLIITGKVIDAVKNEGKEKILVSLYENLSDTAFTKTKPLYFSRTDKQGNFKIENLKAANYAIYAVEDKNQNYYFDQATESIAFLDHTVTAGDTSSDKIILRLSLERAPLIIQDKKNVAGKSIVKFNRPPLMWDAPCIRQEGIYFNVEKDSLIFWNFTESKITCILKVENLVDTIVLDPKPIQLESKENITLQNGILNPGENIIVHFSEPIRSYDTSKFKIEGVSITNFVVDTADSRKLTIHHKANESFFGVFIVDSLAISGRLGATNFRDTFQIKVRSKKEYAGLELTLDSLTIGSNYILQIMQLDKVINEVFFIPNQKSKTLTFTYMNPGNFAARLILDKNKNGHWDPIDYKQKLQAEPMMWWTLEELRADWDVKISLKP
ncbi:MAG: Ig-like domain-containing protein [Bacteroidota bacterium]|nr:Ig-like domain-containing protein [Bacteroidota bacterium]